MTINFVLVIAWMDQFRRIPPEDINSLPIEARIAWRRVNKG